MARLPDAREQQTMTVADAGTFLKLGRSASYAAARAGVIPTFRIGSRLIVRTAELCALLGFEPDGVTRLGDRARDATSGAERSAPAAVRVGRSRRRDRP